VYCGVSAVGGQRMLARFGAYGRPSCFCDPSRQGIELNLAVVGTESLR